MKKILAVLVTICVSSLSAYADERVSRIAGVKTLKPVEIVKKRRDDFMKNKQKNVKFFWATQVVDADSDAVIVLSEKLAVFFIFRDGEWSQVPDLFKE